MTTIKLKRIKVNEEKAYFFQGVCTFSGWLLKIEKINGLTVLRGYALSAVDWLTIKNRGILGLNFFRCVCAFFG